MVEKAKRMLHMEEVGGFLRTVLPVLPSANTVGPVLAVVLVALLLVFCGFALYLAHDFLKTLLACLVLLAAGRRVGRENFASLQMEESECVNIRVRAFFGPSAPPHQSQADQRRSDQRHGRWFRRTHGRELRIKLHS